MKELIARTFEHCFDQSRFETFIKNLFNEIELIPAPIAIPSGNDEHITNITFLAEYTDERNERIDVLVVKLPTTTKVERARSFQRNLIAKYLKDNVKDAALVAFYTEAIADWRLSFIKVEYKVTDKGVKVEAGTPPKRFSFLVGEGEPSHTAQTQLFPILKEQKTNPCVFDIEDAFGVEKVTKEFYDNYRQLYDRLTNNLQKNHAFQVIVSKQHIVIEDFAKKLLGQIVFLYFLQKKGWIGVPSGKNWGHGDKFFLQTIFKKAKEKKENFHNNYLEPLFYDTLNNSRRDEVDPSYSRLFECKIPFLNGGLFDPEYDWRNTFVNLNDDIFEDILAVFDLYNFTVKEDEPLEKEVAVDPEMLGKVFENLLPENLRKGRGAYYTPREIVHYMCQESLVSCLETVTSIDNNKLRRLIAYKDTDRTSTQDFILSKNEAEKIEQALIDLKICDPACGSGAFLVGMLNEVVGIRRAISKTLELKKGKSEHQLKTETIQNCIYGVDIDPGAVDIAKLRLWLSLVVDYELKDVEPLPNLDYKIMCGNSLLEELVVGDESIQLFDPKLLGKVSHQNDLTEKKRGELKKQLSAKQKEFFKVHTKGKLTSEKQKELKEEIIEINKLLNPPKKRAKTANNLMQPTWFKEDAQEHLKALRELHLQYFREYAPESKKQIRNQIEKIELEFIKHSVQKRVNDIDVRIKNLNMQLPDHRKQQAELMKKKLEFLAIPNEIHRSKVRPYFLWKLNFFEVFKDKGGFDIVIANPPYGAKIEKEQLKYIFSYVVDTQNNNSAALFIDYGKNRFLNKKGTLSYIVPKSLLYSEKWVSLVEALLPHSLSLVDVEKAFEKVKLEQIVFVYGRDIKRNSYVAQKFLDNAFIRKIIIPQKAVAITKAWICDVTKNELDIFLKLRVPHKLMREISETHRGVALQKYLKDKGKHKIIGGKNIFRYGLNGIKGFLTEIELEKKKKKVAFMSQKKIISQDLIAHIQNPNPHIKIMSALDEEGIIYSVDTVQNTVIHDRDYDYKYILGLLNSKFVSWYTYKFIYCSAIRTMHFDNHYIGKIPIPKLDSITQKKFIIEVDKMIDLRVKTSFTCNDRKQKQIKLQECKIDDFVFDLYELTTEERKLVLDKT